MFSTKPQGPVAPHPHSLGIRWLPREGLGMQGLPTAQRRRKACRRGCEGAHRQFTGWSLGRCMSRGLRVDANYPPGSLRGRKAVCLSPSSPGWVKPAGLGLQRPDTRKKKWDLVSSSVLPSAPDQSSQPHLGKPSEVSRSVQLSTTRGETLLGESEQRAFVHPPRKQWATRFCLPSSPCLPTTLPQSTVGLCCVAKRSTSPGPKSGPAPTVGGTLGQAWNWGQQIH